MKSTFVALFLALTAAGLGRAATDVDPYPPAYAASLADRRPLVVFVGQPARDIPGMRSITVASFPDAAAPSVVVGVVHAGGMERTDLTGLPATPVIQAAVTPPAQATWADALGEVNAARAARGLRPFVRDAGLTSAAAGCAEFRAARLIAGHTSNDFAALPAGAFASSAGCAAWEPGFGWGACCTYDGYTYAGAAYSYGRDGRRYMHLFVR
jgi:hypothetical protein